MHILFLDESGNASHPNKIKNKYFVIGGLAIPEGQWHKTQNLLQGLKTRKGIRGEIKWRYFAPGNDDAANPMKDMSATERDDIRREIYEGIICSEKSIKSIACVTSIAAAYEHPTIRSRSDLYTFTYKPVSERFQYYLQDLSRQVGRAELGIIVCDHRGDKDDKRFRAEHESLLHTEGSFQSRYHNLVECLFLVPSHLSVGIQLADMVAGAVWRKFEIGDCRWYDLLKPSIRCKPTGEVEGYGIVKFPTKSWR